VANGASRGGRQKIDSLADAIVRVGLREIFRIVTQIVTNPAFQFQDSFAAHGIDLWRHSLAAAVAAQALARELTPDVDPEVAYTAALLHDLGKVVLAQAAGEDYFHMVGAAGDQLIPIHKAEQESFRLTHAGVGGDLLRAWHFPPQIIESVVHHHNPFQTKDHSRLAAIVYFSDILAYRIGHGGGPFPRDAAEPDPDALSLLNLEAVHLDGFEEQVGELFRREEERLQQSIL
jgi:putative nucleotidyltransferase with HDIG domain